jgi:1,4-alpha-glucan branching enzyme/maltooligosyltrehalose trehalohydrolase
MQAVHEMPFGAHLLDGGRGVEFRLWAPQPKTVQLLLGRDAAQTVFDVERGADGWCRRVVADAGHGTRYCWQLDDGLRVPDPASRFNPDGPHAASEVIDPRRFDWSDDGWSGRPWHEAVIYELHVGAFTLEGSYAAAERRLPELAELGITAVQLMPLADFPGRRGWGYDGVLPYAPYHGYGRPEALKRFVCTAHRLGLMVYVDVVYNHFGPDGNYLPTYAPDFLSRRHATAWGSAFNFDGPNAGVVRAFFLHNALYWLEEYHVDGLRFDAVHAIVDEGEPHLLQELSTAVRARFPRQHKHLVLENERNEARLLDPPGEAGRYDGQWNDDFHHCLHVHLTGERDGYYAVYDEPLAQLARVLTQGYARSQHAAAPLQSMVHFLQNHDHVGNRPFGDRLSTLVPDAALRLAMATMLLAPSPPLLFMGEEVGARTPFLYFTDWSGQLREAVRNGRRREFAAFLERHEQGGRVVPDPSDDATFAASRLDATDADTPHGRAWRAFVAGLLQRRERWLGPHLAQLARAGHVARVLRDEAGAERGLYARWRFDDGHALEMTLNLGDAPLPVQRQGALPPLIDVEEVASLGSVEPYRLGAWAGRWQLGRLAQG